MTHPRLLIVSNNCLSSGSSNGRTLRNFLIGWPKEKLAQFYIQSGEPDFSVCENYYRVTDGQALRALLGKKAGGPVAGPAAMHTAAAPSGKSHRRDALTMLLRAAIWNSNCWQGKTFRRWTDSFAPEAVLLQAGDCTFMFRLAEALAKKYNAPLIIYNSEGYYFKDFDYFRAKGLAHLLYPLFLKNYRRQFEKTLRFAEKSIYICQSLADDYEAALHLPAVTIYTATELRPDPSVPKKDRFTVSYLGNLGVGRHEPLIEIATALQEISPDYCLDVYGKIPNAEVQQAFDACPGICHKGFVSYDEVVKVMQSSHLLVHGESFSAFYREDLKYAFSTKLADSLASGTCFLLYAAPELACSRYLAENDAAFVANDKDTLKSTLQQLARDPVLREKYLPNAAALVAKNHSSVRSAQLFQTEICQIWENRK